MARPVKSVTLLETEHKTHYTKKQLAQREEAEKSLLSGISLHEEETVKEDPIAHQEFVRVRGLLAQIGKCDDLYSGPINRYCLLKSDCTRLERRKGHLCKALEDMEARPNALLNEKTLNSYMNIQKLLDTTDKSLKANYRLMADIEKGNLMSIAASLKATTEPVEQKSLLMRVLDGDPTPELDNG